MKNITLALIKEWFMKFLTVLFFVGTALLLINDCNTTEPPIIPPPDDTISNTIILTINGQTFTG